METRDKHDLHSGTSQNMKSRGAHPKLDQLDAEPKQSNQIKKKGKKKTGKSIWRLLRLDV